MNDVMKFNVVMTMDSKEIADLVEARHDSVKRTIERLVEKEVISQPPLVDGEKASNGVTEKVYQVIKRDSFIVVAQLSPEFTARLVDRWQELEAKTTPRTFAQALRLAAEQQEEIERQAAIVESQKPLVMLAKAVIAEDRLMAITDAGKEFGIKRDPFFERLSQMGWIYKRKQYDNVKKDNPWLPTATAMDKGYLELKERIGSTGRSHLQAMVTPKGMTKLSELFS